MWSSLQHLLETAIPHVLIILDCCFAANAARDTTQGTTKELLAACGRENPTLGVGLRSFTSALIDELRAFGSVPFTVAMLHSRLITMRGRLTYTPIYALLSEHGGDSIYLEPVPHSMLSSYVQLSQVMLPPPSSTKVLLAVSVTRNAELDVQQWTAWLQSLAPADVQNLDVSIESIYRSHSTLVLFTLSICVWDRLRNRSAYQFIAFIESSNILPSSDKPIESASNTPGTLLDVQASTGSEESSEPQKAKSTGGKMTSLLDSFSRMMPARGHGQHTSVPAAGHIPKKRKWEFQLPEGAYQFRCNNCSYGAKMLLKDHAHCILCSAKCSASSTYYDREGNKIPP